MTPPGDDFLAKQKVSGTPTASMRYPREAAVSDSPFRLHFLCAVDDGGGPEGARHSRRMSSRSIMMICAANRTAPSAAPRSMGTRANDATVDQGALCRSARRIRSGGQAVAKLTRASSSTHRGSIEAGVGMRGAEYSACVPAI